MLEPESERRHPRADAERTELRLALLAEAGQVFSGSLEIDRALEAVARLMVTFVADICLIDLREEDGSIRRVAAAHADPALQSLTQVLMDRYAPVVDGPTPAAMAMRTAASQWNPEITEDFLRRTAIDQAQFELMRELEVRSFVAVPLVAHERVVGAMTLIATEARSFDREDVILVEQLAGHAALAIDNARLFEESRHLRGVAEVAAERLSFLVRASDRLAGSLDTEETLGAIARVAVPALADWCTVDMLEDDGTINQSAVAHVLPEREPVVRELRRRYPPDPELPHPVWSVLRSGSVDLSPDIRDGDLAARAVDEEHLELLREVGIVSHLVVPMVARGRIVGAISFVYGTSGRHHSEEDRSLAIDLARRAALAVDNARLYRDQLHIARTLQASLLPPSLPELAGLEIAARYRAAGSGVEVGGDFYDAFVIGGGGLIAAIGDVCGRGAEAAALTGLARHTLRVAGLREESPAAILRTMNRAIREQAVTDRFCTVCSVGLRPHPEGGGLLGTVAAGGHPLPIVARAGGSLETVGVPGTLLGIFEDVEVHDRAFRLARGDGLILCTDGVVDRRSGAERFGPDRLSRAILGGVGGTAEELAGAIERAVEDFGDEPRDDSAVLVIRYSG